MSQDFKIQNICDHRIIRELGSLKPNRTDITVLYPIASESSLILYVDSTEIKREDYDVLTLEDGPAVIPRRIIRLKKRIKSAFPLVEVSYYSIIDRCPKCLDSGVVDDIKISSSGDVALIKDEALLLQQVEKFIITRLGSNTFHNWMGTTLQDLTGTKITDMDLIRSRVIDQVNSAVDKLRDVQNQQQAAGRVLTPGEIYGRTIGINVAKTEDPSTIEVVLFFTARSGKQIEFSQLLELERFKKRLNI